MDIHLHTPSYRWYSLESLFRVPGNNARLMAAKPSNPVGSGCRQCPLRSPSWAHLGPRTCSGPHWVRTSLASLSTRQGGVGWLASTMQRPPVPSAQPPRWLGACGWGGAGPVCPPPLPAAPRYGVSCQPDVFRTIRIESPLLGSTALVCTRAQAFY